MDKNNKSKSINKIEIEIKNNEFETIINYFIACLSYRL